MNQAIISFDTPAEIVAGDFGPTPLIKKAVVKVITNVVTNDPDSITDYADIYVLPQAANVNLANKNSTTVTKYKAADVTAETEHPFGVGVGYVKIHYVIS